MKKLSLKDIDNVVKTIINEQNSPEGIGPFPPKKEIAPEDNMITKSLPPSMRESNGNVTNAKAGVKQGLISAQRSMKELIRLTEVNPEIGGIVGMIEKTLTKFEEVFGLPKSTPSDSKK